MRILSFLTSVVLSTAIFVLQDAQAAADPIFSGPQPGEKTTGFKVIEIGGAADGTERDPILDNAGAPTVLVFVHTVERSLLPLLRVVEQYGVERRERIKTEVIFLAADRRSGEERVRAVNGSLKLRARVGLSPDGAEGPGNFGLNKECMMTIVMAKDNVVTANFALVQPGIADAPKVIAALAKTCGDAEPPTVEALTAEASAGRWRRQRRCGDRVAEAEPAPRARAGQARSEGLSRRGADGCETQWAAARVHPPDQ